MQVGLWMYVYACMQFVTGMVGAKPIFLMQQHPNILHILGSIALDRKIAILSNFVHGGNLQDLNLLR